MELLGTADRETLRLAPLWVFSALTGSHRRLDPLELDAFWRSVEAAERSTSGLARDLLRSVLDDPSVVERYGADGRPVVTGLRDVVAALAPLPPEVGAQVTTMLVDQVGARIALARGPFGRLVSRQDAETLQLVAELLDIDTEDSESAPAGGQR